MKKSTQQHIANLFESHFNEKVTDIEIMPHSGSYREYCRLKSISRTIIGTWNEDRKENMAFIEFSKTFKKCGINAPEVYACDHELQAYLQEDIGDTTLFRFISDERPKNGFSEKIVELYRKVLKKLPEIQIAVGKDINYNLCYPRASFDIQSMMWDLNYFKYYFLKLAKIPFDEQLLEDDFEKLTSFLLETQRDFFLYRDFQSRNIMIQDNEPWFIDFQGGRKGALQYDLASLLYDSKADIPQNIREELIEVYLEKLEKIYPVDRDKFYRYFYGYVLIRIMQAMGAYGFRGFYEKKEHFLESIPFALANLKVVLDRFSFPSGADEIEKVLNSLLESEGLKEVISKKPVLTARITSFSYKSGIPADPSGNGGGHVFDCRHIDNPGRYKRYKNMTGKDEPVIKFFEERTEMEDFLGTVFSLASRSIEKYLERKFTHISISFGCTGGQHRSVYSAERLARYLKNKYLLNIIVLHREQDNIENE